MKILVLNSGSSSQKSALFEIGDVLPRHPPQPLWEAKLEWEGKSAKLQSNSGQRGPLEEEVPVGSRRQALERLLSTLTEGEARVLKNVSEIDIVGHRVVHGGERYENPALVTSEVKNDIARLAEFAPLHNRAELEGIELIEQLLAGVPQVAAFDTAFHRHLPENAAIYPGPYEWYEQGIRRYGFHGINHEYCAGRVAQLLEQDIRSLKIVTCHLGNGCSLAAVDSGRSIDTTMGFTPLEGLMMGTRCGSIDPGVLTFLIRRANLSGQQLDEVLNQQSGLLGISGISSDMRRIQTAIGEHHARARLAFEVYVHRLQSCLGAMIAVMGGVDALVFTAGVGENSPETRSAACANFKFLGLVLDSTKNANPLLDQEISSAQSAVRVFVIRAQEDWAIARSCWTLQRQH